MEHPALIRAHHRYKARHDWLETYHLFSFGDYYDPDNLHFGTLRVYNDDTILPHSGFGMHPHRDMEIVTLVLSGAVTHTDSLGHTATVSRGDIQRMSAGTGIQHAEENSAETPLHLHQIWFMPSQQGIPPAYQQAAIPPAQDALTPLVSGSHPGALLTIHSDAHLYRGTFTAGTTTTYTPEAGRGVFLYLITGSIDCLATTLTPGDQLRYQDGTPLTLTFPEATSFVLIDVPLA